MSVTYRVFGSELSPYSVKVRSWFRYKQAPHEWILRSAANMEEFKRYAKLPLIPLVVTPDGKGLQDSTPIMETLESVFPEPATDPADPALRFLSHLIEEYGDEWGNKPMFHYRWAFAADAEDTARRIAAQMLGPDAPAAKQQAAATGIVERMVPRRSFVGSSDETAGEIEGSLDRQLEFLERHLASRPYLFGGRPCFGDLGLFAELYEASTDPTPGAIMRDMAPNTLAWIGRMLDPKVEGKFEGFETLAPALKPLLADEIGARFLPWSQANAEALAANQETMEVMLPKGPFRQTPQKYHARSLAIIKGKYAEVRDNAALRQLLDETGCLKWLEMPTP
ncbi:MAG: glutathione S-transferase family protein [Pseudomonadota bacterium]|nr:glutathione S-transferase family protein [Pseudomonadota bacterium]